VQQLVARALRSKSRVMLSSISTKPLIGAAPASAPAATLRTGAICTRSSWPGRVVVTNCASGWAAPRAGAAAGCPAHAPPAALEDGIDRAAEADQLGAAGQAGRVGQRAELHARAVVVEQHAAVEVAHHHALRELAHQRGQAVALLFDAAAGLRHLGGDVAPELVALARQFVDGVRQRLHIGRRAGQRQFALHVGGQQHLRLFQQPRRRGDPAPVDGLRRGGRQADGHQRRQQEEHQAVAQQGHRLAAFGFGQRGPQQGAAAEREDPQQHRRAGGGHAHREQQPLVALHAAARPAASRSATFCTSSLVEKGLVM
jgi:hypothetical protein